MIKPQRSLFSLLASAIASSALATASADIAITGDWVLLGDVANVTGAPAQRQIAAAPMPGQRMPLASEFIEAQAHAAGYPVDLPDGQLIWVTRPASAPAPVQQSAPARSASAPAIHTEAHAENEVPMLAVDVRRGDEITPDMIIYETIDPNRRVTGLIREAHVLEGMEATRTLRAGQPLAMRDIQPVSVIRSGDPIQLIYERGALRLVVAARAMSDAAAGETVRVQNLQSNRSMDAIAWAPGEARVGTMFAEGG